MAFKKSGGFGGARKPFSGGGERPRFANKGFSRGGDRGFGGDSRPVQLFSATCAQCRKVCEVPFRPNGEKPVFCRDCFGGKKDSGRDFAPTPRSAPSYAPKSTDTNIDDLKRQVEGMNKKLDTVLQLIESLAVAPAVKATKTPRAKK